MTNEKPLTPLGKRILEAREEMGMSQRGLADAMSAKLGKEIQGGYISKIATGHGGRGKSIDPKTLFAMAEVLDVEPRWLWLGEGPKRAALVQRYRTLLNELRAMVAAKKEAGAKVHGKLAKLVDEFERAHQRELQNAEARERERATLRPTGTHGGTR